jgi:hypothetical protein
LGAKYTGAGTGRAAADGKSAIADPKLTVVIIQKLIDQQHGCHPLEVVIVMIMMHYRVAIMITQIMCSVTVMIVAIITCGISSSITPA